MSNVPGELELSKLDQRVAELAERYRPLAVAILQEAIRIPADEVDRPVDDGGDPRSGLSNHESHRLHFLRDTAPADRVRAAALALVAGGAAGNLLDRLRTSRGVVDFIDVGIGAHRFYVFNLADVGVTTGAVLLALALWRSPADDRQAPGT